MATYEKTCLSGLFYDKPEILDVLINYLKSFNLSIPMLSVGSGNGYVEYHIKENLPNINMICVDPDPESFNEYHPKKHIKPTFNYLSDIDCTNYQNSVLLLNWPNPHSTNKGYDVNAIIKLAPVILCVSYGPCGASGSDNLINMLAEYQLEPPFNLIRPPSASTEMLFIGSVGYNLIYSYTLTIGSGYGFSGKTKRLVIYIRQDFMENFACDYPVILSEKITGSNDMDCTIC